MVGQKGKMFKFLKKLWCWFGTVLLKKGKGFELREEPPQGLQAKELTATVSYLPCICTPPDLLSREIQQPYEQ